MVPENVSYSSRYQICAGQKIYRQTYSYHKNQRRPSPNRWCPYCPKFLRVYPSYQNQNKEIIYSWDYNSIHYSGSPLWKWMGKKKPRVRFLHLLSYISFSSTQITLILRISFRSIKRLT